MPPKSAAQILISSDLLTVAVAIKRLFGVNRFFVSRNQNHISDKQ